jgi:hypothetical protein
LKYDVRVPVRSYDLFMGWIAQSWNNQTLKAPDEIAEDLIMHAITLEGITDRRGDVLASVRSVD